MIYIISIGYRPYYYMNFTVYFLQCCIFWWYSLLFYGKSMLSCPAVAEFKEAIRTWPHTDPVSWAQRTSAVALVRRLDQSLEKAVSALAENDPKYYRGNNRPTHDNLLLRLCWNRFWLLFQGAGTVFVNFSDKCIINYVISLTLNIQ